MADLLDKLLVLNPKQRLTALEALDHDWFWTEPLPVDPAQYVISQDFMDQRMLMLTLACTACPNIATVTSMMAPKLVRSSLPSRKLKQLRKKRRMPLNDRRSNQLQARTAQISTVANHMALGTLSRCEVAINKVNRVCAVNKMDSRIAVRLSMGKQHLAVLCRHRMVPRALDQLRPRAF